MGRLTGCCGCFDLREGSLAIGITMLVLGSLGLAFDIAGTVMLTQQGRYHGRPGEIGQLVLLFGKSILLLIMNALLVYGVNKSRRGMILAWIIYSGIVNSLLSLAVVIVLVVTFITGIWWLLIAVLLAAAVTGLMWYWFVVVQHYYQQMREQDGFTYNRQENVVL